MSKPTKTPERAAFEKWYATRTFDYGSDPIGSGNRECELQWAAWQGAVAHLAERDAEVLQEWKSLLANLASVVRVQNGNLHEDINKLLAHADALLAQPSKAQVGDATYQVGVDVSSSGVAVTVMRLISGIGEIIYQELHQLPAHLAERDVGVPNGFTAVRWVSEVKNFALSGPNKVTCDVEYDDMSNHALYLRELAEALLDKPSKAQPTAPDGWVMAPREPTTYMLAYAGTMNNYDVDAGGKSDADHIEWWKAMLAAAPKGVM